MYVPRDPRESDQRRIDEFCRQNDFVTVVGWDGAAPLAAHLLVEFERAPDGGAWIHGHMARANPLWRTFDAEREVLVVFLGPHTYVPARWYAHVNVPTWNYIAVHAYGAPRLVTDDAELRAMLSRLVDRHERGADASPPYRVETLPEPFVEKEMRGIVGFRIRVTRMEARFKLSQNRDDQDHATIVRELERRGDEDSMAIARAMRAARERHPSRAS